LNLIGCQDKEGVDHQVDPQSIVPTILTRCVFPFPVLRTQRSMRSGRIGLKTASCASNCAARSSVAQMQDNGRERVVRSIVTGGIDKQAATLSVVAAEEENCAAPAATPS
jgi:hypothetical protein